MADMSNVMERLKNYILQHPELRSNGIVRAFDNATGNIIVFINGEEKSITIDELESGILYNNVAQTPINEEIEVMEEPAITSQPVTNNVVQLQTLKDIDEAAKVKNEDAINKALSTFAIDNAGNININKAIKIVTDNTVNDVVNCVRDNKNLPVDLSGYDIKGNAIGNQIANPNVDIEALIQKSFDNIKVYVEVARLKNVVFTEEQIKQAYKKYSTNVHDKLNVLGLNKKEEKVVTMDENKTNKNEQTLTKQLKPDTNIKKAGFADILILTIIVLIYAVIIINLVSKLN